VKTAMHSGRFSRMAAHPDSIVRRTIATTDRLVVIRTLPFRPVGPLAGPAIAAQHASVLSRFKLITSKHAWLGSQPGLTPRVPCLGLDLSGFHRGIEALRRARLRQ
jgi:hypothetical protein